MDEADPITPSERERPKCCIASNNLAARVSTKLEEGVFRGAVRLASSAESVCSLNEKSLNLLKEKHPPAHSDATFPPPPSSQVSLTVNSSYVRKAVMSFPAGSTGGPDGLRPQHLKDLISPTLGEVGVSFAEALASFVTLVISGNVPQPAAPFFFGASLLGCNKPDEGTRPIAIGCTLRRLAAKSLGNYVFEEMGSLLFPLQLGYGTRMGAEGAVHAARAYLSQLQLGNLFIKVGLS
jgi:hypothetical protein